ncbi:MAG: hypothetical protein ABI317_16095 [Gaiellales bacterium]
MGRARRLHGTGRDARGRARPRAARGETGLECAVGRYLGGFPDVYGDDGDATLNLAFECRFSAGEPRAADDVAELAWFAPTELPPRDRFAFPNSLAILDSWRATQTS